MLTIIQPISSHAGIADIPLASTGARAVTDPTRTTSTSRTTVKARKTVKDSIGLPFTMFRARDALDYAHAEVMTPVPADDVGNAGMAKLYEAGMLSGSQVSLLFSRPGLSLTYVWFKSGFPLPRHSHDADCAYFIISGSLRMGEEVLGPGDGFFIGKNVPYAYIPGENGVEVLEIRTSNTFDFKGLVNNPTWFENAAARTLAAQERWQAETSPLSGMEVGRN